MAFVQGNIHLKLYFQQQIALGVGSEKVADSCSSLSVAGKKIIF